MKKKEIRTGIKEVYRELWSLLSLYEASECFNMVPKEERMEGDPDEDVWDFVERKLSKIREKANVLFLGEKEIVRMLNRIIDETEYFTKQCKVPGVVDRWKRINQQILYFDCAFDIMDESPELYLEMRQGLTDVHLDVYPDEELRARRDAYFAEIEERNERENLHYSDERIFQNELLHTLTLLFENDFEKYLYSQSSHGD